MHAIAAAASNAHLAEFKEVSGGSLTGEALYVYLQNRLSGIDDQIDQIMNRQLANEAARKSLQAGQEMNAGLPSEGTVTISREELQKILDGLPDHESKVQFAAVYNVKVRADGTINRDPSVTEFKLSQEDFARATKEVDNAITDLSEQGELEMIKLQSLMSARNSAISLATNLMAAIGKGYEAIVGNIRS